jgi:hypothetical protein
LKLVFQKKNHTTSIEIFNKQLSLINEEMLNKELDLEEKELFTEFVEDIQIKLRMSETKYILD